MTKILPTTPDHIKEAAAHIKSGELVSFPTETVYGLGADATNDDAVRKIFTAKNRPDFNPLIVHVSDKNMAEDYAVLNDRARILMDCFWPGPLSIILKRKPDTALSEFVSGGLDTVALRAPDHSTAQDLIKAASKPIAAPSANRSGTLSPTSPQHVKQSLDGEVDIILAGGKCHIGLESTIVDMSSDIPRILRAGFILPSAISDILDEDVDVAIDHTEQDDRPLAPGQLLRHYAPQTPLRLKAIDLEKGEALLAFGPVRFMGLRDHGTIPPEDIYNLSPDGDLTEAASNLFSLLHEIDQKGYKQIAAMDIPNKGIGVAINDRMTRAARAQDEERE